MTQAGRASRKTIVWAGMAAMLAALALGFFIARARASSQPLVITWGEPGGSWGRKLHVSAIREGCSGSPTSCINEVKRQGGKKVFLSILLRTAIPGSYGPQYGMLAREVPSLVEVGADDFVGQYEKLFLGGFQDPTAGLTSLIDGIKAGSSNVGFGLTLYEDDLQSPYLSDSRFPAAERAKVDYVHLFMHYRTDTPNTPQYVQQAKTVFPNAQVILGIYAYDRISYLPCSKGGQPCTAQQEQDYLKQGLDIDLGLVKNGTAAGIEFWPNTFGKEEQWSGWDQSRICPGRKAECVQNTQQMHQIVAQEFQSHGF